MPGCSPQEVSENLFILTAVVAECPDASVGQKYFDLLMRHFSVAHPTAVPPLAFYTYHSLSALPEEAFGSIFTAKNIERLGCDILSSLPRCGSGAGGPLPGMSLAAALVLSHALIAFEANIFPHQRVVELLAGSSTAHMEKLRSGYLVLDGVEYRLPPAGNVNCLSHARDKAPSWGKHAPCLVAAEGDTDGAEDNAFVGWIFMDYLYAALSAVPGVDRAVFGVFAAMSSDLNPCHSHALVLATHWARETWAEGGRPMTRTEKLSQGENPIFVRTNSVRSGELYRSLCWGRWLGSCALIYRDGGLGPKVVDVYRLLHEPAEMRQIYHQVSISMLRDMRAQALVDPGDQSTYHSAISGALSPDHAIRSGKTQVT